MFDIVINKPNNGECALEVIRAMKESLLDDIKRRAEDIKHRKLGE